MFKKTNLLKIIMSGVKLIPRIIREADYPIVDFLNNPEIVEQYKENIQKYGDKARKALDIFTSEGKGSNPFAVAEMGKYVRLALPSELEQAVRENPDFFKGRYEEPALVLRTNGDSCKSNDYLAKNLFRQVKKRTGNVPTPENPARISLKGTKVKKNDRSDYGLSFLLTDESEILFVPEFAYENNQKTFSITDERGVPIFDNDGDRTFYARKDGLSTLSLNWGLTLHSLWHSDLADSYCTGRVVIVSYAVSAKKLDEYVQKLEQERDKQKAELDKKFQDALKVLKK